MRKRIEQQVYKIIENSKSVESTSYVSENNIRSTHWTHFVFLFSVVEQENDALKYLKAGFCRINLVKRTGQRSYMMYMLLLPFLPIIALILQNSLTLKDLLQYQFEVQDSWLKGNYILTELMYKIR